jgi:2-polyprenyl-6-methoxyphenol hydroxylase-like FAD-dependent oxidoreductase
LIPGVNIAVYKNKSPLQQNISSHHHTIPQLTSFRIFKFQISKPHIFTMSSTPSIAIIGAGPGGLTLARLLHINGLPCTVFESDVSAKSRPQGGSLDLHATSGQAALKAAGLYEEFDKIARREGDARRVADKTGKLYIDDKGHERGSDRPEVDRMALRQMLLDSLPAESIRWGSKVASIDEPTADGRWAVSFIDSAKEVQFFDLVVGADGAWSKVRPLLTDEKPFHTGHSGVEFSFRNVDVRHPKISALIGEGSYFATGNRKALVGQRNGDATIRVYSFMLTTEDWIETCGIDWSNPAEAKEKLVTQYYSDWDQSLQDLIRLADDDSIIPRKLFMLPVGIKWSPRPGVTLIGDAAHLMGPFAGIGVNLAMNDAMDLAAALTERKHTLVSDKSSMAAALEVYETEMFKRGQKAAQKTLQNGTVRFSENGLEGMVEQFKRHGIETEVAQKME